MPMQVLQRFHNAYVMMPESADSLLSRSSRRGIPKCNFDPKVAES
jgi:hypothetical protein